MELKWSRRVLFSLVRRPPGADVAGWQGKWTENYMSLTTAPWAPLRSRFIAVRWLLAPENDAELISLNAISSLPESDYFKTIINQLWRHYCRILTIDRTGNVGNYSTEQRSSRAENSLRSNYNINTYLTRRENNRCVPFLLKSNYALSVFSLFFSPTWHLLNFKNNKDDSRHARWNIRRRRAANKGKFRAIYLEVPAYLVMPFVFFFYKMVVFDVEGEIKN